MMSKRRIAVLVAGMLVGAQVGIASMSGPAPSTEPQESLAQGESAEPTSAPEQAETQTAPAPEQAAASEQPAIVGTIIPPKPRTLADATLPELRSDVFPPSTDDKPLLPALAAYLDRKAANTLLADAGAPGSPFPDSAEPGRMLPAQVAYFDRIETERIAAAEARAVAQREQAAPAASSVASAELPVERVAGNIAQ
jgi:hypothetical protein